MGAHFHSSAIRRQVGFTLVEVMVSLGILAALAALTFINLGRPQTTASVTSVVNVLVADIASERQAAMAGDAGSTAAAQPHGIHFENDHYTLFAGASYDAGDSANYTATLDGSAQLHTTLPGNEVLFDSISGEVHAYDPANNTIAITADGFTKTITLNRLGTVTVN